MRLLIIWGDVMSIIRVVKDRKNPYAQIDKEALYNPEMSWKAKGILAYLLSKPDDWKININDLEKKATDGRDSVRTGLIELEKAGHIHKKRTQNNLGKFSGWDYVLYESPKTENPTSDNPTSGKPTSEKPISDKVASNKEEPEKPVSDELKIDKPKTENPKSGKPISEKPTSENPTYTNNEYTNNDLTNKESTNKDIYSQNQSETKTERQKVIFDYWNNKKMMLHKRLTDKIKRSINGALRDFSVDEIKQSIDNYYIILTDDRYYWTHTWRLTEFLQRGLEQFLVFEIVHKNFFRDKPKKREPQKPKWQSDLDFEQFREN